MGGRPLDPAARYRVVMPDFLAEGGDGYTMLTGLDDRVVTGRLISDMVMEAFRSRQEVSSTTDGRILRQR